MAAALRFESDPGEPLAFATRPHEPPPAGVARALAFELSSRGDRVPGRLELGPAPGPLPLVLLVDASPGAARPPALAEAASAWAADGAGVACVDLPLCGARSSPKLSELLAACLRESAPRDALARALVEDFLRQAVIDLRRSLDALSALPGIDASRVGLAGFGLGATVGAALCSVDARPHAVALAFCAAGPAPEPAEPRAYVAALAPRPQLFVHAAGEDAAPPDAAHALFEAAGEPKQQRWIEGPPAEREAAAARAAWEFLRPHLRPA